MFSLAKCSTHQMLSNEPNCKLFSQWTFEIANYSKVSNSGGTTLIFSWKIIHMLRIYWRRYGYLYEQRPEAAVQKIHIFCEKFWKCVSKKDNDDIFHFLIICLVWSTKLKKANNYDQNPFSGVFAQHYGYYIHCAALRLFPLEHCVWHYAYLRCYGN